MAAFDKKAVESARRQLQITDKKAEREAERLRKQAQAAAKPAVP